MDIKIKIVETGLGYSIKTSINGLVSLSAIEFDTRKQAHEYIHWCGLNEYEIIEQKEN